MGWDGIIGSKLSVSRFVPGRLDALCKEPTSIRIQKIVDIASVPCVTDNEVIDK